MIAKEEYKGFAALFGEGRGLSAKGEQEVRKSEAQQEAFYHQKIAEELCSYEYSTQGNLVVKNCAQMAPKERGEALLDILNKADFSELLEEYDPPDRLETMPHMQAVMGQLIELYLQSEEFDDRPYKRLLTALAIKHPPRGIAQEAADRFAQYELTDYVCELLLEEKPITEKGLSKKAKAALIDSVRIMLAMKFRDIFRDSKASGMKLKGVDWNDIIDKWLSWNSMTYQESRAELRLALEPYQV